MLWSVLEIFTDVSRMDHLKTTGEVREPRKEHVNQHGT